MKKIYRILNLSFSFCLLSTAGQAAATTMSPSSVACSPTPDCVSLGYVSTKAECEYRGIKCPFADKWYCTSDKFSCGNFDINGNVIAYVSTEAELLAAVNSGRAGIVMVTGDIVFTKNVGVELKKGQSIVGFNCIDSRSVASAPKLTFAFDSDVKAIGIDLADRSKLSDLIVDYTTVKRTNKNDFHAVRNNKGNSVELNNLRITVNSDVYQDVEVASDYTAGIKNFGGVKLFSKIYIAAPSKVSSKVFGISGEADNSSTLIQDKNSTLTITTSGAAGSGISRGRNDLSGNVIITSIGEQYGNGLVGCSNVISGRVRVNIGYYNAYGAMYGDTMVTSTGEFVVNRKVSGGGSFYGSVSKPLTMKYDTGAKIAINSSESPAVNGVWQATGNGSMQVTSGEIHAINNWVGFKRLGDF